MFANYLGPNATGAEQIVKFAKHVECSRVAMIHAARTLMLLTTALVLGSNGLLLDSKPAVAQSSTTSAPISTSSPTPSVVLQNQSAFVLPGETFNLTARVSDVPDPQNVDLVITIFGAVRSRSAFLQSLNSQKPAPIGLRRTALTEAMRADSTISVQLPVNDAKVRETFVATNGVFPVVVELQDRESNDSLAQFTTDLIKTSGEKPTKLGVVAALPVNTASNSDVLAAPSQGSEFSELSDSLGSVDDLPVALGVSPESVERVNAANTDASRKNIAALASLTKARENFAQPWAPFAPELLRSLSREKEAQLDRGTQIVSDVTHNAPNISTWIGFSPTDQDTLGSLQSRGNQRAIIRENDLANLDRSTTIGHPIKVRTSNKASVSALQADAALTDHIKLGGALGAQHLLADLAVIQNDYPAQMRAVVAMAPQGWLVDKAFLDAFLPALRNSPDLKAVTLDQAFGLPFEGGNKTPLTRSFVNPLPDAATKSQATRIESTRKRIDGFDSMTEQDNPLFVELNKRLLYSETTQLAGKNRNQLIDETNARFEEIINQVRLPIERSIRLTARTGDIPVSVQNDTGYPIQLKVRLSSDSVTFPNGKERLIAVDRQQSTERFRVESRTSGRLPIQVFVTSPDGTIQLASTRINVVSTSSSAVGMILTVSSLTFLLVWWVASVVKTRRKKLAQDD